MILQCEEFSVLFRGVWLSKLLRDVLFQWNTHVGDSVSDGELQ